MDLSRTVIPKSDQINFEDVQSSSITAEIKSVRSGNKEQPVWIDLIGFDGRPYKPSKSMRRVLIGGWGSDGHSWAGKSLTLVGDPNVKFGGVAVGGIKIQAMSHVDCDFSMMLSVSRGKRAEHRVRKLVIEPAVTMTPEDSATYDDIINQMGLCQTAKELKEVGEQLNSITITDADRKAAGEVYKACSEKIKNATS
ncbi:Uncharacterised protein [Pragia fontium]|uniref:hypothetical protein n=1 Tax=Pragia fontium TaxID=82985 RepID=UPI000E027BDD|nr:hypothetical protein [Pragia fontium]SUB81992.1 Uncharacterised protein [Pragia fontium]